MNAARGCPTTAFRAGCILVLFAVGVALIDCGGNSATAPGNNGNGTPPPPASNSPFWAQWGLSPQHSGMVSLSAQSLTHQLADIVYDPFVTKEQAEQGGDLVAHFQATLIDGEDFYMESKSGTYPSCTPPGDWINGTNCGPNAWGQLMWNVTRYTWEQGKPVLIWTFGSDWKPEPNGQGLGGWEPVFHPVLANSFLYAPGAGGTLWKIDKNTGRSASHINPLSGTSVDSANTFVAGPLTADAGGNIYYNILWLSDPTTADPWTVSDVLGAWLVKVTPQDNASKVAYSTLVPGAPPGNSNTCPGRFTDTTSLPWPPDPTAVPPTRLCGSQRPGVNIAPAIAADGTVYTVSRAHFVSRAAYLVAVNSDLTPKWQASLQRRLNDGCGVIVPIAPLSDPNQPNSCRTGTTPGVDPVTNDLGSGLVVDQSSSSPTILPDGSILFGANTNYNGSRGHLFKFDANGSFLGAYDFGWDTTPAVYTHGGTYSIVIKDNHYPGGLYCAGNNPICQPLPDGPFYITQLGASLNVEWSFQSTNTDSCHRNSDGSITCMPNTNPNGFEWCVNAPVIDQNGVVYANSEDGNLYSIPQGHTGIFTAPKEHLFTNLAIGAAYTPLSVGPDGKLYVQNDGHVFVVGN